MKNKSNYAIFVCFVFSSSDVNKKRTIEDGRKRSKLRVEYAIRRHFLGVFTVQCSCVWFVYIDHITMLMTQFCGKKILTNQVNTQTHIVEAKKHR